MAVCRLDPGNSNKWENKLINWIGDICALTQTLYLMIIKWTSPLFRGIPQNIVEIKIFDSTYLFSQLLTFLLLSGV